MESGGKYYLSSDGHQLGSGSGQQLVTGEENNSAANCLWNVREAHGEPQCETGTTIKCGDVIRLIHLGTNRNLHTHGIKSALSSQHEVTGFGNDGVGDAGDDWRVTCSGRNWMRDQNVSLQSTATGRYLGMSSTVKFTQQNCGRGCPILNHLEAFARQSKDQFTQWKVNLGVHLYK